MAGLRGYMEGLMRGVKVEVLRETSRQYPVSCCLLLALLALTVLLNRYIHIFMVFWSLLAGIITFYCSLGPDSLLPNVFFPIKLRNKRQEPELFPLGHSCTVCGKIKCKRHRDITEDDACLDEVRMTFRFFASVLIRRVQKVMSHYASTEE
ncbi:hypothetical protein CRENBAI_007206 [Crenichthys baileyi]|uniref:Uncharacterized protein n=1 Tax=Crenichthys baileyi TaxID=28760 RepID=A0AAV9SEL8_9TELE